jgi:hypothetical protein
MARLVPDVGGFFGGVLGSKARVLLINPPVQEKRYHWIRWNQPLELLRLGTWLKTRTGCRDVCLFDFMVPGDRGEVPRHKVKDTWTAENPESLWHFGRPFEDFEEFLGKRLRRGWVPDIIVVSSLTSYWHVSIEKFLVRLCNVLGPAHRPRTTIALYGAYPRFEAEHAETQREADVAFTESVDMTGCAPEFELYLLPEGGSLPPFFALDIEDPDVSDHLGYCLDLRDGLARRRGVIPRGVVSVTFFNDDLFGSKSQLKRLADTDRHGRRVRVDAICGVRAASASIEALELLAGIGTETMYIEYATKPDGSLDEEAYAPFREFLRHDVARRRRGGGGELAARDAVTAFVNIGLPSDDLDAIVRNTLLLNREFQAIILKPFGYSPDIDPASADVRRERWPLPALSSPQWFPYVEHGSGLTLPDYDNLMRWQGIVNKRVKSFTFDFLGAGTVPRLVRETLIDESWKRRGEGQS